MISGSCPEKITYWCHGTSIKVRVDSEDADNKTTIDVIPAFCSDTTNAKTMETAENWAKGYSTWDQATQSYIRSTPVRVDLDNTPQTGYKVVGMESRAQNGRVYKCIDSEGHYFDMPMDILLDIMTHSRIENSEIMCPLVWCRVASQMKLVRYKSSLYDSVIESMYSKKSGKVKKFIAGTTYETLNGSQFIYLGDGEYNGKKGQLWFELWTFHKGDPLLFCSNEKKDSSLRAPCHYISVTKSKSIAVSCHQQVSLTVKDISDWYAKNAPNNKEFKTLRVD